MDYHIPDERELTLAIARIIRNGMHTTIVMLRI